LESHKKAHLVWAFLQVRAGLFRDFAAWVGVDAVSEKKWAIRPFFVSGAGRS
jgi:hypothetical protein